MGWTSFNKNPPKKVIPPPLFGRVWTCFFSDAIWNEAAQRRRLSVVLSSSILNDGCRCFSGNLGQCQLRGGGGGGKGRRLVARNGTIPKNRDPNQELYSHWLRICLKCLEKNKKEYSPELDLFEMRKRKSVDTTHLGKIKGDSKIYISMVMFDGFPLFKRLYVFLTKRGWLVIQGGPLPVVISIRFNNSTFFGR